MNEKQLNELNIHALRELARTVGVNSPTSKQKNVLINEILSIAQGKQQPNKTTKHGRPPKGSVCDFSNLFTTTENTNTLSKQIVFKQDPSIYLDTDISTVEGYVEKIDNAVAFLWVQNKNDFSRIFLPSNILNKYSLRCGDKVVAEIAKEENQLIVKDVFNINNCPIVEFNFKRKNFEDIPAIMCKQVVGFNNEILNSYKIMKGENVYLYGLNSNQNTLAVVNYLNSCNIENKIYLNLSVIEKNKILFKDLKNAEMFTLNLVEDIDVSKRLFALVVERVQRILEQNEDVIIAIDDILTISSLSENHNQLIKALISLAKDTKKGSVSIVSVMLNNNNAMLEKFADKKLNLNEIF